MAETIDSVVKPVCGANLGGNDVELQDCELSSPACDELNVVTNKL